MSRVMQTDFVYLTRRRMFAGRLYFIAITAILFAVFGGGYVTAILERLL